MAGSARAQYSLIDCRERPGHQVLHVKKASETSLSRPAGRGKAF
ncbi:hypothetical protein PSN_0274 [Pseudomonas sp. NGC7]